MGGGQLKLDRATGFESVIPVARQWRVSMCALQDFPYSKLCLAQRRATTRAQWRVSSTDTVYNRGNQGGNGRGAGRKKTTTVNTKQGGSTAQVRACHHYDGTNQTNRNKLNGR